MTQHQSALDAEQQFALFRHATFLQDIFGVPAQIDLFVWLNNACRSREASLELPHTLEFSLEFLPQRDAIKVDTFHDFQQLLD